MKLSVRDIEKFLSAPPAACRVFLFYGPDQGLVRARARAMAARFVQDLNDPFAITMLDGDAIAKDPARLTMETATLALGAGERVVWLREADDKCAKAMESLLLANSIPAIVIAEAEDLGPRSALRRLVEAAPNQAAAVPCYVEDAGMVAQIVSRELSAAGWQLSRDAASWFSQRVTGDRGLVQQEIQKLITYLGPSKTGNNLVDLDILQAIATGGAALIEDAFVDAIGTPAAMGLLERLLSEGTPVVSLIRMIGRHAARLYTTQLRIQSGEDQKSAMDSLQPKLFFKRETAFRAQLSRFSLRALASIRAELWRLEGACKQTGAPDDLLLSQFVLRLSGTSAPTRVTNPDKIGMMGAR